MQTVFSRTSEQWKTHIWHERDSLSFFVALVRKQRCFVCLFVCGLRSEAIHVTGAAVQTFLQEVNAILWPLPCSMLQTQQPQPESVFKLWNETLTMQRGLFIPPRCRQSSVLPVHPFGLFVACHRIFQHFRHIREQKTKSWGFVGTNLRWTTVTHVPTKEKRHEACYVHARQIAVKPHRSVGNLLQLLSNMKPHQWKLMFSIGYIIKTA